MRRRNRRSVLRGEPGTVSEREVQYVGRRLLGAELLAEIEAIKAYVGSLGVCKVLPRIPGFSEMSRGSLADAALTIPRSGSLQAWRRYDLFADMPERPQGEEAIAQAADLLMQRVVERGRDFPYAQRALMLQLRTPVWRPATDVSQDSDLQAMALTVFDRKAMSILLKEQSNFLDYKWHEHNTGIARADRGASSPVTPKGIELLCVVGPSLSADMLPTFQELHAQGVACALRTVPAELSRIGIARAAPPARAGGPL